MTVPTDIQPVSPAVDTPLRVFGGGAVARTGSCTGHTEKRTRNWSTPRLVTHRVLHGDPTRTLTLRRKYLADMDRRFNALKRDVRITVVRNDAFGLKDPAHRIGPNRSVVRGNVPAPPGAFAFGTSAAKVRGFQAWLQTQVDAGILEVTERRAGQVVSHNAWQNTYLQPAYQKGIVRAEVEMKKGGLEKATPRFPVQPSFMTPIHADRVGLIYTRAFSELEGVTSAMAQRMSRTLATGLANGWGVEQMARLLVKDVDVMQKTRARAIARTETIRAHHVATINEYRSAGIEGVRVMAEWSTAGFGVCPDCADMEGRVFTLDEIEPLIPLHPNCRCVATPAGVGEIREEGKRGRAQKDIIDPKFVRKDGTIAPRRGLFEKKTGKPASARPPRALPQPTKTKMTRGKPAPPPIRPETGVDARASIRAMDVAAQTRMDAAEKSVGTSVKRIDEINLEIAKTNVRLDSTGASTEQRHQALIKKIKPLQAERKGLYRDVEKVGDELRAAASELKDEIREQVIYKPASQVADIQVEWKSSVIKGDRKQKIEEGIRAVSRMVGEVPRITDRPLIVRATSATRSRAKGNVIMMSKNAGVKTTVHEMGHWVESAGKAITDRMVAFRNSRKAPGELARRLSILDPGKGYKSNEFAIKGKFKDPYSGKVYRFQGKDYATEVLSTGMEQMYANPVAFARDDPEFFDFVFDLLKEFK